MRGSGNYFVIFPYFKIIRCYNWKESGTIRSRTPLFYASESEIQEKFDDLSYLSE